MANNLTFALKRGKQLSVAQREEGVINALASNPKVKPGRVYDVSISGYSEKLKIKIIGIVTESAYNISLNSGGDVINSTDIFPTVSQMAKSKCDCLLWFSYDDLPASFAENIRRDSNAFVFPKEGITPQQLSFLEDTLNGMGNAHTREDILGFDSEAREYLLKQYIPMFVFLLIITLSGILSAVLVSLRVSLKDYAVYYACGADKRTILYANVLYALVLCAAAALPCSALFILSKYITLSVFGYISTNSYTFLFMLITALLVGAATCIAVMLSLKRLSIRKILCSGE